MSLIALAADKGSPGVTTTAVALAAVWPRPAMVAECDPSGGDLAVRLRGAAGRALQPGRGLLSYAAATRRGAAPVADHLQRAEGGLELLLGLQTAEQAPGLNGLWTGIADGLAGAGGLDVFADCGRLGPGAPTLEVLRRADQVLLVTRSSLDAVVHLRDRLVVLLPLLGGGPDLGVVVVAPLKHSTAAAEVAAVLEQADLPVPVLGSVVDDAEGAAGLRGEPCRRLDRTWLVRSAREVATHLERRLSARAAV